MGQSLASALPRTEKLAPILPGRGSAGDDQFSRAGNAANVSRVNGGGSHPPLTGEQFRNNSLTRSLESPPCTCVNPVSFPTPASINHLKFGWLLRAKRYSCHVDSFNYCRTHKPSAPGAVLARTGASAGNLSRRSTFLKSVEIHGAHSARSHNARNIPVPEVWSKAYRLWQ